MQAQMLLSQFKHFQKSCILGLSTSRFVKNLLNLLKNLFWPKSVIMILFKNPNCELHLGLNLKITVQDAHYYFQDRVRKEEHASEPRFFWTIPQPQLFDLMLDLMVYVFLWILKPEFKNVAQGKGVVLITP